jgi:HD superfamily phosphohydrolase
MSDVEQPDLPGVWPKHLETIYAALGHKYTFVREIARGRTGATFLLARDDSGRKYCLKTISPSVQDEERQGVADTLRKEVEILDPLSHRCIPIVYERDSEGSLPFYVCTFHPGHTFQHFAEAGNRLSTDEAVYVIGSLIDAMEYLHDRGRTHCDFHQKNILISERVFAEGILIIDFGSGHRESDTTDDTKERGDLRYKTVQAQARYRSKVNRHQASASFRAADFVALGHLLSLMADVFFSEARHDQRLSYSAFCAQLRAGELNSWPNVREAFAQVVDPAHLMSGAERLFLMADGTTEFIRIPVSGAVPVGEAILAVINTSAFQRLRLVNQLSFCDWIYPGGKHTRFEHSLGVLTVAHSALQKFARDRDFHGRYTRLNFEGTLLAALLHDVGHYPFAHLMEHYVASRFGGESEDTIREAKQIVSHSSNSISLLENDVELRQAISRHWGESHITEAIRVLEGNVPVLSDLVDGPIDCDKLDYVRRDAHHCGVEFGSGLDVSAIVESYCSVDNGRSLGVDASGVQAVEGFMVAQEQMLATVYWNEYVRAVTAMFHAAVASIVVRDMNRLADVVARLKNCGTERDAIRDVFLPELQKIETEKEGTTGLLDLIAMHQQPRFTDIFFRIQKYTELDQPPTRSVARKSIYSSILGPLGTSASVIPIDWAAVQSLRTCYLEAFREKSDLPVSRFEVVIDVPFGKASNRVVTVRHANEERPITQSSHLNDTIFTQPTVFLAPIRVYISPRVHTAFETQLVSIVQSAEERFYAL